MIKYILINRLSDGLILCQTSSSGFNQQFETLKIHVKNYHRQSTSKLQTENTTLKQIENHTFGIYYRVSSYVVFTAITESTYPIKLINAFIQSIISAFFDEAKCSLGSSDINSRIQNIQGSHYFIKFDRILKQKKKDFDDPNSIKNIDRVKKQLQNIHGLIKQNMELMDKRDQDLINTRDKAYRINQESKKFQKKTKDLVWHLWFKKNLIWISILLLIFAIYILF